MTLTIDQLNAMAPAEAAERLRACCGSSRWVNAMVARRPFGSVRALLDAADEVWRSTGPADWDQAFAHHPRIGERQAASVVSATARRWSAGEQDAAARSDVTDREALAAAGVEYERKFGRIYIVCATGLSAGDILADIRMRMRNDPERERAVAAEEQRKITRLRLEKLVEADKV